MTATQLIRGNRLIRMRAFFVGLVAALVGIASYVLAVRSTVGQAAEATVLGAAEFTTDPPAPLNLVSAPAALVALILVGSVALAAHGVHRAVLATAAPAIAILAAQVLKLQILDRPGLWELDAPNTFPSGHMTVFAALLGGIILAVPTRLRGAFAVVGAIVLSAVSWQLLAFGWHRPSDIIGALALTLVVFAAAIVLAPRVGTAQRSNGTPGTLLLLSGALALVAALVLVGTALALSLSGDEPRPNLLLLAGQLAGVGASLLCARAFLTLGRTNLH